MMRSTGSPRMPGSTLLKIARLMFNAHRLAAVVEPTIADLQREIADAGGSRIKRLRARWRGYFAFWRLTLAVPLDDWGAPAASPAADAGAVAFPDAMARLAVGSILVAVLAVLGPAFGARVAAIVAAGAVFAILIHGWYDRHPSELPSPIAPQNRPPQINFSSTEVAGNIGGFIFVVGSVFVVVVGVPSVIWFLFAATAAGCFLAWALVSWHRSHPNGRLLENRIVLR